MRDHHRPLFEALLELESAIAVPAGDLPFWLRTVEQELTEVAESLREQVAECEGPGGMFDRVMERAPRLAHKIERLRDDHVRIALDVRAALDHVRSAEPGDTTVVGQMREECMDLFLAVSRHRHEAADLVYEAFDTELGGGA